MRCGTFNSHITCTIFLLYIHEAFVLLLSSAAFIPLSLRYVVRIGARDRGNPSLESEETAQVTVDVTRNNNAPVFNQTYTGSVRASDPNNTFIITVRAVDPDPNSVITYRIICE